MKGNIKKNVAAVMFLGIIIAAAISRPNIQAYASDDSSDGYVSLYSKKNPPEFYGLTKATIQKGTEFDISMAQFRIFAKDFEDGDLTPDIKVVSNNVNTDQVGEYSVKYSVTDSHGNSTSISVPIEVVEDDTGNYYERTLYSLPSDLTYMSATGTRGMSMDRQITGFMLRANATIRIKHISGAAVTAQVFSRLAGSKKNYTIKNDTYQDITWTDVSTVLIKTPYNGSTPTVIGIQVPADSDVVDMPYYHYKDDEAKFRAYWKSLGDDTVGIIENEAITFHFLPTDDPDTGFKNSFSTIDEGLEYFETVADEYAALQGYELDATELTNQEVRMKLFAEGGGANNSTIAYYTTDGIVYAQNANPTSRFFGVGWVPIHEIGHGFQGLLKDGSGMVLNEVSNNILAYYVQNRSSVSPLFKGANWLGAISSIEEKYNSGRKSNNKFSGYGDRLYFFVELLDLVGYKEAYAAICQNVRKWNYEGKYSNLGLADKVVMTYYEKYHLNVSALFEAWGITVTADTKAMVMDGESVAILKDVLVDDTLSASARDSLGLSGVYSYVKQSQLESYNLTGTVKVTLNIDDIKTLIGKTVTFTNGTKTYSEKVTSNTLSVTLPVGFYQVTAPVPINNIYNYTSYISATSANGQTTEYTIDYTQNTTTLANDTIVELWGQGYNYVSKISLANGNLTVQCSGAYTHGYFSGNYITVDILDENDNSVLSKEYKAAGNSTAATDTVPYKVGYKIKFYHAEGANMTYRVRIYHSISNTMPPNITTVKGDNTLIIGPYGLYQDTDAATNYQAYKDAIDEYAKQLIDSFSEEDINLKTLRSAEKVKLLTSINELNDADQKTYKEKYNYIFNGSSPTLSSTTVSLDQDSSADIYSMLKGNDLEDGTFELTKDNFKYDSISTKTAGTYDVNYSLTDLDGNVTSGTLSVTVKEVKKTAKTIKYTVKYWKQNIDDDEYTLDSEETLDTTEGTLVYPESTKFDGFTSDTAAFTPKDGEVIDIKYNRKTVFLIYDGNGSESGALPEAKAYRYGTKITLPETKLTRKGYVFSGWGDDSLLPGTQYEITKDVTLKAQWTKDTSIPETDPATSPITASVSYSQTTSTNQSVTATVTFSREAFSIEGCDLTKKDDGTYTYTFTENGTQIFTFLDSDENIGIQYLDVNWIDKVAPTADITYSTTEETDQPVTVTLRNLSADARVVNNNESRTYTFSENGEFSFILKDMAGNETTLKASVSWIKESTAQEEEAKEEEESTEDPSEPNSHEETAAETPSTSEETTQVTVKKSAVSKASRSENNKKITVNIKKVSNADGYQIRYSTNKNFTKSTTKTITIKGSASTAVLSSLNANKTYYISVRAYNTESGSKTYSKWSATKTVKANVTVKKSSVKKASRSKNNKKITISLKKVSNASGYQIRYSTSKKFTKSTTKTVSVGKKTTKKTISSLNAKKTYYVSVRTYRKVNGKKVYSAWSTAKKVKSK